MTIVSDTRPTPSPTPVAARRADLPEPADPDLDGEIQAILHRRPCVGLAVAVVRDGRLAVLRGHGLADIASATPVTEDTVFRIGSLTKLFTTIAILQLWEQGRIDLDGPANEHLRAYRLVPTRPAIRQPTIRELLTHTAGIPEVVHITDLLHPDWGPFGSRPAELSVPVGEPLPSLADYYRGGLGVTTRPGTAFQYTNHGFATLGRIVEDVSGIPLPRYFHERVFEPLGMQDTDLVRSERVAARLAIGYAVGRTGPAPVPDRDWICAGAGSAYSTAADMARFIAALLGGGANEHGRVLESATLSMMIAPHYQPDPRVPGRGLGFARGTIDGHATVSHDGLLPGFDAALLVAPDDGVGVFAVTNGSSGAFVWLGIELDRLLRRSLGAPEDAVRADLPQHPERWGELCGRYQLPAGTDLRGRLAMGAGAQVHVRGGRLMARILTPVPVLLRGLPLLPDDLHDPDIFRLDLSALGLASVRIVFVRRPGAGVTAAVVDLPGQPLTLHRRPTAEARGGALIPLGALAGVVTGIAVARWRHGRARHQGRPRPEG